MFASAVDLGAAGWDPYYGYGRVDAAKAVALAAAAGGDTTNDTTAPSTPQATSRRAARC